MQMLMTIAVIILIFFVASTTYVALRQSRYIYVPDRDVSATPLDAGLQFEDLSLKTDDGETVKAWYVPSGNADDGTKTILFCHGNAGDMGDRIWSLQTFNKLGFNTLIFDYRGYGESSGEPTEQGTYLDVLACWDCLVNERGVRPKNIVVFGRSLGGAIASRMAANANPGALVLESVFSSVPDMAHKMFPYLPVGLFCRFKYDNVANVARVKCPVLVAHSREDHTCPFSQGQKVFAAANEPKQFVEIKGGHNDGGLDSNPDYQEKLVKFLEEDNR